MELNRCASKLNDFPHMNDTAISIYEYDFGTERGHEYNRVFSKRALFWNAYTDCYISAEEDLLEIIWSAPRILSAK